MNITKQRIQKCSVTTNEYLHIIIEKKTVCVCVCERVHFIQLYGVL